MKRLLEQIGLTLLVVLAIVFYFGKTATCIIVTISACLLIAFIVIKKFRKTVYLPVMASVSLIACIINLVYTANVYDKVIENYDGFEGNVVAQLKEEPYKSYGGYVYEFNARRADNQECDFDFIAYYADLIDIEVRDQLVINMSFHKTDSYDQKSKGYFLVGDFGYNMTDYAVVKSDGSSLYYKVVNIRKNIRESINSVVHQPASQLCNALLLGDKSSLPSEIRDDFLKSGTLHLVVVSGLHFSVLVSIFFAFALRFKKLKYYFLIPGFIFMIFYMLLTGASGSVVRSAVMMFVCGLGIAFSRSIYSPNSIGLAAIVVLVVFGPYSAGDIGVILSFASTYSILRLTPDFYEKAEKYLVYKPKSTYKGFKRFVVNKAVQLNKFFVMMLCVNISAYLISVPLSVIFFDGVSVVSVFSSFVLALPVQILLVFLLVLAIVIFLPVLSFVEPVVLFFTNILSEFILATVSLFADLSFSYVYIDNNYADLCALFTLVLFALALLSKSRYRTTILALSTVLMFFVGSTSATLLSFDKATLNIYNVGNGIGVYYESPSSDAVVYMDCANSRCHNIISKIEKTTSDIDFYANVSDTNSGRNCLISCAQTFAIDDVLLYDSSRSYAIGDKVKSVHNATDIYTVNISGNEKIVYYYINGQYVVLLFVNNYKTLILPDHFDVSYLPDYLCKADTIVVSSNLGCYERLSCDTLILSVSDEFSDALMSCMHSISNRVLLTKDGDIEFLLEV